MARSRVGNLQLYKFDLPYHSDVGVVLVTQEDGHVGTRFRLTKQTGQGAAAGLSQSFVDLLTRFFFLDDKDSNIINQIFTYLSCNFSFKDLQVVPPACPVLVFHIHIRDFHHQDPAPNVVDITQDVLSLFGDDALIYDDDDVQTRFVPILPTTTEILDCYRGHDLCFLCQKGYPKAEDIVYKTVCNHIFHASCISTYLFRTPHCPVCSLHLLPVDVRKLLFLNN